MAHGETVGCDALSQRRPARRRAAARGADSLFVSLAALLLLGLVAPRPLNAADSGSSVSVLVTQGGSKPLGGTVLMLHRVGGESHPPSPLRATMDQINRMFVPDVLVIPVGSTVSFPNTDKVRHQVYSFSPTHPFQLPLYSGRPYAPEHFDRAGLVTLGCNIHDWMLAYIVVTDADYFGLTDGAGKWTAKDVPAGRYQLQWWHPRLREYPAAESREVVVAGTQPVELRLKIASGLRPPEVGPHPHSWDTY